MGQAQTLRRTARPFEGLPNFVDRMLVLFHGEMSGLTARHRGGEQLPRLRCMFGRKLFDGLQFASELEAEVIQPALQNERAMLPPGVVDQLRFGACSIAANELHWDLRPFDAGARNSGSVREIT